MRRRTFIGTAITALLSVFFPEKAVKPVSSSIYIYAPYMPLFITRVIPGGNDFEEIQIPEEMVRFLKNENGERGSDG